MRLTILVLSCLSIAAAGCGSTAVEFTGDVSTDGHADGTSDMPTDGPADTAVDVPVDVPVDVGTDDGIVVEHGECTSSADCDGLPCIRVPDEPGGYWLCQSPPRDEATECNSPYPEYDQCCTSADCTEGRHGGCFFTADFSIYCGGPEPLPANVCLYDECMSDAECAASDTGRFCLPADLFGWPRRRCAWGTCKLDTDCTREPGGYCAPLPDYCCPGHIQGFFCIYPGACATQDDCDGWEACMGDWSTGGTICDFYACPA